MSRPPSRPIPPDGHTRSPAAWFAAAVALPPLLVWLAVDVVPLDDQGGLLVAVAIVTLIAWQGGLWPSLVAALVGALTLNYFSAEPINSFRFSASSAVTLGLFLLVAGFISWITNALKGAVAERVRLHGAEWTARARAEQAAAELRRGQALLDAVIDNSPAAVFVKDLDGRYLLVNRSCEHLAGRGREEIIGHTDADVFPPAAADLFRASDRRVLETGRAVETIDAVDLPGGSVVLMEHKFPLVADGETFGICGVSTDVTALHRAEEAQRFLAHASGILTASLDLDMVLQRLVDLGVPALGDIAALWLRQTTTTPARQAIAAADPALLPVIEQVLARFPMDRATPHGFARVVQTGEPELLPEITDDIIAAVAAEDAEDLRALQALGLQSTLIVPLRGSEGVIGALAVAALGTHRPYDAEDLAVVQDFANRAALALDNARLFRSAQGAEARYRALFEGMLEPVFVTDAESRLREVNPSMTRLLGYSRDELLRMRAIDLPSDPAVGRSLFDQVLTEGRWTGEVELRRKDGRTVPVESSIRRVALDGGAIAIGALHDVSAHRGYEQLRQELIDAVAHDLKNPLTAITGQAQLLLRRLDSADPAAARLHGGLTQIEAVAARMVAQLGELQEVVRLRTGQPIQLRKERADLVELTRRLVDEYQRTTDRHELRVETAVPSLTGVWDRRGIERAVANLLINAIKYSPHGGPITLSISRERATDDPWAVLAVRDEGVGVPPDDLPHIFEHARRGSNVAGWTAGTGIGLAGTHQIVTQHGGEITVESGEGAGSTFTIRLPLAKAGSRSP